MTTRRILTTLVPVALALALGWWARSFWPGASPAIKGHEAKHAEADGPCPGGATPAYWKAPMDPTYIRDEPGKSPMGMDLVPVCAGSSPEEPAHIEVDPAVVQTIGVRTALVEKRDLVRTIRAVGRVSYDERRVVHVHTKVQGWVERLHVEYVGQAVKRGQPLLEIYSPELVATQEELLLAVRYRRDTSDSPFDDVRSSGASLFEATRRRLELWDVSEREIQQLLENGEVERTLTLHAPTSGVVTDLMVRTGMEVAPNSNLYTIADLSRVWVVANVYEFELPWVEVGDPATVELSYLPGTVLRAPVAYVSPFLDPKTRTAEVRIELPNPDGRLKPEMFGNAIIETAPRRDVTAVPSEAVIRTGRRSLVMVALGGGRFVPREVELGMETGGFWTEVRSGLQVGERIVVSSQFLIDSESKLQEAVQKLLAERRAAQGRAN